MAAPIRFHKTRRAHAANVYRLLGRDEDALTYALGHLMAIDDRFMIEVLKRIGVLQKVPGKQYKAYRRDYRIHLQELREIGPSGRRDIVIEAGGPESLRAVVEAKVGPGQPDACQLLRYTVGCGCGNHRPQTAEETKQMWGHRRAKFIVALTRDALDSRVSRQVSSQLDGSGIELQAAQWHQILEVALERRRQLPVDTPQSLFLDEFINFFREHYEMKYYDAEVLIADVDSRNAQIYWKGHAYVGGMRRSAPLYFAPYFTRKNREDGLSYISRVLHVELVDNLDADRAFRTLNSYFSLKPNLNERWQTHWKTGLQMIFERAAEGKWGGLGRVYFLDEPVKIRDAPLRKRNFPRIPFNYGGNITVADLILGKALGQEASL